MNARQKAKKAGLSRPTGKAVSSNAPASVKGSRRAMKPVVREGALVMAHDRMNYGRVVCFRLIAGERQAQVKFVQPDNGAIAFVDFPLHDLTVIA